MIKTSNQQGFWQARCVAVLGAEKSGRAAAKLLYAQGAHVTVLDDAAHAGRQGHLPQGICIHAGGIVPDLLRRAELIVRSPGIPLHHPACVWAQKHGISIVTEIDIACAYLPDCTFIGVTGTNGKSTTTCMLGAIFASLGDKARGLWGKNKGTQWLGGNLGTPLCEAVLAGLRPALAVLELSSFQLQSLRDLRLAAAIVTNIGVDHTKEHGSHENYIQAKARIVELLQPGGVLVCRPQELKLLPLVALRERGGTVCCVPESSGKPHETNAAMAASVAASMGVSKTEIAKGLSAYRGLPHRFELVGELGGVRFINDSKATNVAATLAALQHVGQGKIHLILGGQSKGESYGPLLDACRNRQVAVYMIGDEAPAIGRCLAQEPSIPCVLAQTLARAVHLAWQAAVPGETILLAPACPSFDQFANFAARGEAFEDLFQQLRVGKPVNECAAEKRRISDSIGLAQQ